VFGAQYSYAVATRKTTPAFVIPMAAHLVSKLPDGPDWLYEIKWDGYRALLIKDGKRAEIRSRNDKNLTTTYPAISAAVLSLDAEQLVIDGEIVALDPEGRPSFQALQHRGSHQGHRIAFHAFDVLHLNGRDLTTQPLTKRRELLAQTLGKGIIRESLELPGSADDVVNAARDAGLEGVIAKRRDSPYQPGERSHDWVKLKLDRQQEFVVGGYRPTGAESFDALLVGVYEGDRLLFAGKVRAGFTPHVRRDVMKRLGPLRIEGCPFANLPDEQHGRWGSGITIEDMKELQWVSPRVVVQIRFVEWTAEGRLRHAVFLGLRTDKPAREVRREA
jgi:bifunctional non-homologous end joining protein LigD